MYSHLLKKLELSKLCRKKSYRALKIPKMDYSKQVKIYKKKLSYFFPFFKHTLRKIFDYKEIFFLFYVA